MSGNPFESGARKVIPAVLIYVRVGDRVLMLHRNTGAKAEAARRDAESRGVPAKRQPPREPFGPREETATKAVSYNDYHEGKWNGLGGKLELDESPFEAAARELREESGLSASPEAFRMLGVVQFPNFKAHKGEDWMVFVFALRLPESAIGEVQASGPEGDLHWIPAHDLLSLNLWAGDRHFIPYVVDEKPFAGTIWYEGQAVARHWIAALT